MNSTDLAKSDVTLHKPVIICSIPCGYLILSRCNTKDRRPHKRVIPPKRVIMSLRRYIPLHGTDQRQANEVSTISKRKQP